MARTRRSSLEVAEERIAKLKSLEAKKAKLEKDYQANIDKPIHLAIAKAIIEVTAMIASIVRLIKRKRRKS